MLNSSYDPDQYWDKRGGLSDRRYTESPAYRECREAQFEFFRNLVAELQPMNLLDFGCGSGRLFRLWAGVPHVDACDRARSQIEIARAEAVRVRPNHPYRVMHSLAPVRADTPYDDNCFDLIVAADVLQHVAPEEIGSVVAELHRVCRGQLAIVTSAAFDDPGALCFDHDYPRLFANRFEIVCDVYKHKQRYIIARKIAAHTHAPAKEASNAIISP